MIKDLDYEGNQISCFKERKKVLLRKWIDLSSLYNRIKIWRLYGFVANIK